MSELKSIHQFVVHTLDGKPFSFSVLKGKKCIIVNTASKCGLTPQFEKLQKLYDEWQPKGLLIIAFPCNDFFSQERGDATTIQHFCQKNYGVTFPVMEKIHVRGKHQHPVYKWLTSKAQNGVRNSWVKWNFQKYLINEDGTLATHVNPWVQPDAERILDWLSNGLSLPS
ncbi:MAG: glutathione peroxidase [Sediminibacterium sp.]|nr:glutathione peroxidase [Sediminibacterium sp.]